jgi:hypothetical protein
VWASPNVSLSRMPVPKSVLTALAAAVVVVTTAAPAVALSEDGRDARRDVLSGPKLSDDLPGRPEPARKVGDIVANSASYGVELTVRTRFRSLAAIGQQEFSWFLLTADDPHASWNASLVVQAGKDKGRFTLLDPIANQPGCGTATLDRAARTVTLTIPASCLGDPDWVKVGNGIYVYTATRRYADDARLDGVVKGGWKYGPKVKSA